MISAENLRSSVLETNNYFQGLLDLVPSSVFFDLESNQKLSAHQGAKTDSHDGKNFLRGSSKKASRHLRYDPSIPNKTSELQKILPQLSDSEPSHHNHANGLPGRKRKTSQNFDGKRNRDSGEADSSDKKVKNANDTDDEYMSDMESAEEDNSGDGSSREYLKPDVSAPKVRLNPEQLREKLQNKIAELQAKRQKGMTPEEFLEAKRLRRKASKLKLKQKRKEAKKLKLSVEKQTKNSISKLNGVSEVPPGETNTSNGVVFSKFEFSEQAKKMKANKSKKPKSYKELYEKVLHPMNVAPWKFFKIFDRSESG